MHRGTQGKRQAELKALKKGIVNVARYNEVNAVLVVTNEEAMFTPGAYIEFTLCGQETQTQKVVRRHPLRFEVPQGFCGQCTVTLVVHEESGITTECTSVEFTITPEWTGLLERPQMMEWEELFEPEPEVHKKGKF